VAFRLIETDEVRDTKKELAKSDPARLKKVHKALGLLETNPRHPGLNSKPYRSLSSKTRKVFESYVENRTPAAFRIFWHYGPGKGVITVLAIVPHP
jgi:hypothetical protein